MLIREGVEKKLTTKESELLRLLCLHRNGLLERRLALREIWGDDNYFNGRSMDVYIAKLRKYLKDDPEVEIINNAPVITSGPLPGRCSRVTWPARAARCCSAGASAWRRANPREAYKQPVRPPSTGRLMPLM